MSQFVTDTRCPLFLDWLAVSLSIPEDNVVPLEQCSIVEQSGTKVWNRRALILNEVGDKVATVLWSPKSSIIPKRSALLEVANEWFYHGRGCIGIVNEFCGVNNAVVTGVSRVDLACDFELTPARSQVVWGLAESRMYIAGKRNGSGFWSICNDRRLPLEYMGVRIPHCLSWGHKSSGVKWKLYYKWKELCDAAGSIGFEKCYIVDAWRDFGCVVERMWRLEVSLRNLNTLARDGVSITLQALNLHARDIFTALYSMRFSIRVNEGHIDKSNDTRVDFLPVGGFEEPVKCRVPVGDKPRNAVTTLLRQLIKSLDDVELLANESVREGVIWQIEHLCTTQHLVRYASAVVEEDIWSWIEAKRVEAFV